MINDKTKRKYSKKSKKSKNSKNSKKRGYSVYSKNITKRITNRKNRYKNKYKQHITGGKKKHKQDKISMPLSVDSYHKYLHLGKTEQPKYSDEDFVIQNHPSLDEISRKILFDTVDKNTYSLFPYFFMPHTNIETQDDYTIESGSDSGNCVFFAKKVLLELNKQGIHGYLIPATTLEHLMQPGFPEFCHCVVLVKTQTHFIIYEPAFYIIEPIYIPFDGSPVKYNVSVYEKSWSYRFDANSNRILVEDGIGNQLLYYYLRNIINPSTAISYPVNIHNKRIPVVKYNPSANKKTAHLSIRLDTKCLEGFKTPNNNRLNNIDEDYGWFPRLNYLDILNTDISESEKKERLLSWEGLSENQCQELKCNRRDLVDKIYLVIGYHHK